MTEIVYVYQENDGGKQHYWQGSPFPTLYPNTLLKVEFKKPDEGIEYVQVKNGETIYIHRITKVQRVDGYRIGRLYTYYKFFTKMPTLNDLPYSISEYKEFECPYWRLKLRAIGNEENVHIWGF
jgi:hypothetical protein